MNLHTAINLMKSTDQIPGKQTVWEHGISVRSHLLDLIQTLTNPSYTPKYHWQIPPIFNQINWGQYLYDKPILARYALFHDIGKPWVVTQDEYG